MVLEAAFDDSPPTNDTDPYSTSPSSSSSSSSSPPSPQQSTGALQIDLRHASRSFPILGPLTGFTNRHLIELVSGIAKSAPVVLARPLSQDEVDASVAAVSKYMQVHSWIYCTGLTVGFFKARGTTTEMAWPGAKWFKAVDFSKIDYGRLGGWKGPLARAGWNAIRTATWVAWWGVPAYVVGGVAGQIAMAQTQLHDPRLKGFHEEMKGEAAQRRMNEAVRRRQSGLPNQSAVAEGDGDADRYASSPSSGETMSERGGEQYMRSSPREPSPRSSMGDRQMSTNSSSNSSAAYRYPSSTSSSPSAQPNQDDDDASPFFQPPQPSSSASSQPQLSQSNTPSTNSQQSGPGSSWDRVRTQAGQRESAWDRIRRQGGASPEQSASSWQSQASGNSVPRTDSFTFDEREEDRQLAKAEAQRDFDARIERERQGRDFAEGSRGSGSGGGRW